MPGRTKVISKVLVSLALIGGSFLTACTSQANAPQQIQAVDSKSEGKEEVIAMQNEKPTDSTQPEQQPLEPVNTANSAEETQPLNSFPLLLSFTPQLAGLTILPATAKQIHR